MKQKCCTNARINQRISTLNELLDVSLNDIKSLDKEGMILRRSSI